MSNLFARFVWRRKAKPIKLRGEVRIAVRGRHVLAAVKFACQCCALAYQGVIMKTVFALLALLVSTAASSACYLIYTPSNELVWRGVTPPVAMDTLALNDAVQKMVPEGHLIISNDAERCTELALTPSRKTTRRRAGRMK